MANSQAIASSFKSEVLNAVHQLGSPTITSRTSLTSPTVDTVKAALYLVSATTNGSNSAYTATGEVSGAGYSAGGVVVTNASGPTTSGTVGIWTPSASIVYTAVTLSTAFDAVMLYNSTQGNKAIGVYTFGSQTVTAGNFTLTMPTNDSTHALIQLA
jgi:hypothetical protein